MSRLDEALARLEAAIDRLDSDAGRCLADLRQNADSVGEIGLLKAERERLFARVAGLEEEARTLAGITEEVEDRLDGTISEIREVLGRN